MLLADSPIITDPGPISFDRDEMNEENVSEVSP